MPPPELGYYEQFLFQTLPLGEPRSAAQLLPDGEDVKDWRVIRLASAGDAVGLLLGKVPAATSLSDSLELIESTTVAVRVEVPSGRPISYTGPRPEG